jgi:ATP-binding cassette subfamily F protein uup
MERMGSKIIELHKISKKGSCVIMDNFSFDFQRGERIGIIVKRNRKIDFLEFIDRYFTL